MKIVTGRRLAAVLVLIVSGLVLARLMAPGHARSLLEMVPEDIHSALTKPYFTLKGIEVTPLLLVQTVLLFAILVFVSRMSRRLLRNRVLTHTSMDEGQRYAIEVVTGYAVFIIGLMVGLQSAGIDLSSLTFLGGAIGIGIGFGLQTIVSNFVSGLILLFERPIRIGDRIEVAGTTGDVMRIGPRATWIRGNDNAVIIVPNSMLVTGTVLNWTAIEQRARFSIKVAAAYDSDVERVREVLLEVARAHKDVLPAPAPEVILVGLGDSSLQFELRVWTVRQVHTPGRLQSDLLFAILTAFRTEKISIPFPQREVRVTGSALEAAPPAAPGRAG